MKSTVQLTLPALCALFVNSCAVVTQPVQLYAVKGSEVSTAPHVTGVILPQAVNSGSFKITWPSGETGVGHYSGITNFSTSATRSYASGSGSLYGSVGSTSVMASAYESAWGTSFTSRLSAQTIPILGMMVTNTGRRVEFMGAVGSGTFNGFGVAKDNRGNVWRVIY